MRLYYTTDGSIDENLEQVCPFGEKHHFTRNDGSKFTMWKNVGCGGCKECPYCYGAGFQGYYGSNPKKWVLVPVNKRTDSWDWDPSDDDKKAELGKKQFRVISLNDYVKCAMYFNENYRVKSKKLKFKLWWWHHIGMKLQELHYKLDKLVCDIKCSVRMWWERNVRYRKEI